MSLTDEACLTKPDRPIPQDNPNWSALRERVNTIGANILKERFYARDYRPLGIVWWGYNVSQKLGVPQPSAEKRANEIADSRWYDTPLWVRLPYDCKDLDPVSRKFRPQSSYLPNPWHPSWTDLTEQIALCRRGGQSSL